MSPNVERYLALKAEMQRLDEAGCSGQELLGAFNRVMDAAKALTEAQRRELLALFLAPQA